MYLILFVYIVSEKTIFFAASPKGVYRFRSFRNFAEEIHRIVVKYIMCDCGKGVNPREILNLPMNENLTEEQVTRAYRKCALKCHPDKYRTKEATEIFQKINNARDTLLSKPHLLNPSPPKRASPPKPAPASNKRCPKGTRKHKTNKLLCVPKNKPRSAKSPSPKPPSPNHNVKRCPNGTRKNPKSKRCEPKK